jgi:hypothetical protein
MRRHGDGQSRPGGALPGYRVRSSVLLDERFLNRGRGGGSTVRAAGRPALTNLHDAGLHSPLGVSSKNYVIDIA